QDAKAGAEALLWMWLGLHDRLDERDGGRADRGGMSHHPGRGPLGVAPVRTHVAGDAAPLVEDLDRRVGDAGLDLLADQARGYRVVVMVDLDVIVGCDAALLPFGVLIR